MMEVERVSETLGSCPELTRSVAREDFFEFSRCERFKSWTITNFAMVWNFEVMSKKLNVAKAKLNLILEL
jgi:hypothetical protein